MERIILTQTEQGLTIDVQTKEYYFSSTGAVLESWESTHGEQPISKAEVLKLFSEISENSATTNSQSPKVPARS